MISWEVQVQVQEQEQVQVVVSIYRTRMLNVKICDTLRNSKVLAMLLSVVFSSSGAML